MVVAHWNINTNFWEEHPDLSFVEEFADYRRIDKTGKHEESSKVMWAIALLHDINSKYSNYAFKDRLTLIEGDFLKKKGYFKKHEETLAPVIMRYQSFEYTAADRDMRDWENQMDWMNRKINNMIDDDTASLAQLKEITQIRANMSKSYTDYHRIKKTLRETRDVINKGGKVDTFIEGMR